MILSRQFLLGAIFCGAAAALPAQTLISAITDLRLAGGTTIDFESVTPSESYNSINIAGVTFGSDLSSALAVDAEYAGRYNTQGQSLNNGSSYSNQSFFTITVDFTAPVSAFGFNFGASDNTWTLNAYNNSSTLLASTVINPTTGSNAGDFFGLGVGSPSISHVTLVMNPIGGDFIFIDNFRFTAIPEPSTVALLTMGIVGLGLVHRRRRSALK